MSVQLFLLRHRPRADNQHRCQPSQRSLLPGRQQKNGAGGLLRFVSKQRNPVHIWSRSLRRRFYRHRSQPARHHGKRSVTLSGLKREIRSQARPTHNTCSIVAQYLRDSCSISTQFPKNRYFIWHQERLDPEGKVCLIRSFRDNPLNFYFVFSEISLKKSAVICGLIRSCHSSLLDSQHLFNICSILFNFCPILKIEVFFDSQNSQINQQGLL